MSKIFITSDLHLCHNKEFLYGPRGFSSVYDMNEAIIKNWNSVVEYGDDVYLLGDVMLNDNEMGLKLFKSLRGNIHLILGNHDTDNRILLYEQCYNIVEIGYGARLNYGGYHFYLSHFPTLTCNYDEVDKPLKRCCINLCGHTHTKNIFADISKGLIIHVEMDTNNCIPWDLDELIVQIESNKNLKK